MANAIITPTMIAKEALMQLENNLVAGNLVHRDYKKEFVKVGSTVNVRKPVKFVAEDGATAVMQDVEEANTSITIDQRKHVAWKFTTQDLTLSISEYSERYIKPAAIALANKVDLDVLGLYKYVWNWVGTPGQTVDSFSDFAKGPERLDLMAVPKDMRHSVLSTGDYWGIAGAATGLYMQNVASDAYRKAMIGNLGGVDTYMDQNVRKHTVGAHGGTPVIDGDNQNTTYALSKLTNSQTLTTDGWTEGVALKAGDVFTIADVYSVNPVNKESTGVLQQFVLLADKTTSSSTVDTDLSISPAIITSGPYQNVNAAPADDATITYLGTASTAYSQNMVFHKNAFALVTVPLEMPDDVDFKARETHKGLSLRVIKWYDGVNDEEKIRLDVLYGVKAIYPDLATRLSGTS